MSPELEKSVAAAGVRPRKVVDLQTLRFFAVPGFPGHAPQQHVERVALCDDGSAWSKVDNGSWQRIDVESIPAS
jgi:hypothetical protein